MIDQSCPHSPTTGAAPAGVASPAKRAPPLRAGVGPGRSVFMSAGTDAVDLAAP